MPLVHEAFASYLEGLIPARPAVLQEMEAYARAHRFPIVGPVVGQLFYILTRISGARRVFEMGSGYGYSTAWFAMGVRDNGGGEVFHVVWDEALSQSARMYLDRLGLRAHVRFHVGEAIAALRGAEGRFDIIFNDIDKHGYPDSLPVTKEKLRSGGILIIDNMIWHGQILDLNDHEKNTEAIRQFTGAITTDSDWIVSLTPTRDGMIVAYKK